MEDQEFIQDSIEKLNKRKQDYESIKNEGVKYFQTLLEEVQGVSVSGRVKDEKKLIEKIYRKNYMNKYMDGEAFINDLPDGIGIRIVCMLNEEEKVFKLLEERLNNKRVINEKEFSFADESNFYVSLVGQPEEQKNGLEIYRMDALFCKDDSLIRMEIQIKSLIHYFWGELEHSLFYKNYDYTISNEFYAGLMKNIHSELENIDAEMCALKKHMERSEENQVLELRQMAALMVSKKYAEEIESIIGCKIDLRETYALLVDMFFGLSPDVETNISKFGKMIEQLDKSNAIAIEYEKLANARFVENDISKTNLGLAEMIDGNIRKDVFWKFLFLMYVCISPNNEKRYSEILSDMASSIHRLYEDVAECADVLIQEGVDVQEIIQDAFVLLAKSINKISFFVTNIELNRVKEIISNTIEKIQNRIFLFSPVLDRDLLNVNRETIIYIIYITVMYSFEREIGNEKWEEIIKSIENKNDYTLYLDKVILEKIKKSNTVDNAVYDKILEILGEEEE